MKKAIITIGCSGSGKSTYADSITRNCNSFIEINRDNIRFNGLEKNWNLYKFNSKNEDVVNDKFNNLLDEAISSNIDIIISDTNLNINRKKILVDKLISFGYNVEEKIFDISFEELLKRDRQRAGGVGYEVLLSQYIKFKRNYGGDEYKPYQILKSKPKVYLCDIDGTLALSTKRSPYDYSQVLTDSVNEHVVTIIKSLIYNKIKVIFISGRKDSCREDTVKWLSENVISSEFDLYMRKSEDNRPDHVIKLEIFNKYIRDNYNVLAAIDDRKRVVECCWNVLGINVINVGNGYERF